MPSWILPVLISVTWVAWAVACAAERAVEDLRRSIPAAERGGVSIVPVLPLFPLVLWLVAKAIDKFVDPWGTYIVGGGHLIFLVLLCYSVARDVRRMHSL